MDKDGFTFAGKKWISITEEEFKLIRQEVESLGFFVNFAINKDEIFLDVTFSDHWHVRFLQRLRNPDSFDSKIENLAESVVKALVGAGYISETDSMLLASDVVLGSLKESKIDFKK